MKTLAYVQFHGSQCSRATGWRTLPPFGLLKFTDGSTHYLPESKAFLNAALEECKALGIDTAAFEAGQAAWNKAHSYPEKPQAELYQHYCGWEKPVELGEWSWSTTFGRWSRLVTFADGWHGYSYPKTF